MTDHTMKKNAASIPHSVWPAEDLRRAEKEAADSLGITLYELMQRAGEAAFNIAREQFPDARCWLVLCGHGNNGGDGYVVARLAAAAGLSVMLLALEGNKPLPGEAAQARDAWLNAGGEIQATGGLGPGQGDLIIDGLVGNGPTRAPREGAWAPFDFWKRGRPAEKPPFCGNSRGRDRLFRFKNTPELDPFFRPVNWD